MSISRNPQASALKQPEGARTRKTAVDLAAFVDADAEALLEGQLARWLSAELDDRLTLVKSNALRRIYRIALQGNDLFIKQHLLRSPVDLIKCMLFGSPARVEYSASLYAQNHGVPAIHMLAYCVRRRQWNPHVSITVAEAVANSEPLTSSFASSNPEPELLIAEVARLFATAHDQAFLHRDAHAGNILVESFQESDCACHFVDLQGVRCGRAVNEAEAAHNLAALDQWFNRRASRSDRWRFLKAYAGARHKWGSREAFRDFAYKVIAARERHAQELYRKRDRRIGRRSRFFDRQIADDGAEVMATLRFRSAAELIGMEMRGDLGEAAVSDAAVASNSGADETFFASGIVTGIGWRMNGSPAWRKYRGACVLMNRDLPTVVPLACRNVASRFTVTECGWRFTKPPDGATLAEWLDVAVGKIRSEMLDAVGCLIADTLARGAVVRDANCLRLEVAGMMRGAPKVYWSGADVAATSVPAPRHACVWMLARLAAVEMPMSATRADRARVLRAFCRRFGHGRMPNGWKGIWCEIAELIAD